jgi:hypothetical protein
MSSPQHRRPLWLGALFASITPPLCLSAVLLFLAPGVSGFAVILSAAAAVFAATFAVSLATMLVLGLPYVLWLRSRNMLNPLTICIGAMAAGAVAVGLLNWNRAPGLSQLLYGAVLGLASGIAFCAVARPNNSFKPKPLRGSA